MVAAHPLPLLQKKKKNPPTQKTHDREREGRSREGKADNLRGRNWNFVFIRHAMPLALNCICQESRGKRMFNPTALEMDDFLCIKKRTILHIQILRSIYFSH